MPTRLYVGNLAYETTDNDLRTLFSQAGSVTGSNVITDKFTGKSRGFGFVEMSSADDAQKAIAQFNGQDFQGRALTVNEARPREDRPRSEGPSYDRSSRDAKRDFHRR